MSNNFANADSLLYLQECINDLQEKFSLILTTKKIFGNLSAVLSPNNINRKVLPMWPYFPITFSYIIKVASKSMRNLNKLIENFDSINFLGTFLRIVFTVCSWSSYKSKSIKKCCPKSHHFRILFGRRPNQGQADLVLVDHRLHHHQPLRQPPRNHVTQVLAQWGVSENGSK